MSVIATSPAAALVIGVGNPLRGDDGIGPAVAEALCTRLGPGWESLPFAGSSLDLLTALVGRERVVILDALVHGSVAVGECCRLSDPEAPAVTGFTSSHQTGVLEALALARHLGVALPSELRLFGIGVAAEDLAGYREGLSDRLAARVPGIVQELQLELREGNVP